MIIPVFGLRKCPCEYVMCWIYCAFKSTPIKVEIHVRKLSDFKTLVILKDEKEYNYLVS